MGEWPPLLFSTAHTLPTYFTSKTNMQHFPEEKAKLQENSDIPTHKKNPDEADSGSHNAHNVGTQSQLLHIC